MNDQRRDQRRSFVPPHQPKERWGLLMPAAVVVALLLMGAMIFVRYTGG